MWFAARSHWFKYAPFYCYKWLRENFLRHNKLQPLELECRNKTEQIKNFKILRNVLPLTGAHLAEHMIVICTAITYLNPPLLKSRLISGSVTFCKFKIRLANLFWSILTYLFMQFYQDIWVTCKTTVGSCI